MPSLQEIRQFNQRLVTMGDEPEVVREWGEELEEVPVPEADLDEDLSSLLSDTGELEGGEAAPGAEEPETEPAGGEAGEGEAGAEAPPDFSQLLAEEEADAGSAAAGPEPAQGEPTQGEPGEEEPFDFDEALFGEEGGLDLGEEPFPTEEPSPTEEPVPPEEPVWPEEPAPTEEAAFEEAAPEEPVPEAEPEEPVPDAGPESEEAEAPAEGPLEEGDFSDFEALLGGDFEAEADELEEAPEGFELPDDFSFDEEVPPEASAPEPLSEPPSEPEEEGAAEPPEAQPEDEFAFPEDEFALPEGGFSLEDEETPGAGEGMPEEAGFELPEEGGFELPEEGGFELPEEGAAAEGEEADFGDLGGFEFSDEEEEEASAGEEEFSFEEPVVPGAAAPGEDLGELDEVGEDELDEFSLGDFGAEFGVLEEEGPSDEDLNPAINVPEVSAGVPEAAPAGPGQFQLSDDEFARLQQSLAGLPLNLKQDVEQIIAEAKGTTEEVEKLCRMLVDGESAQNVASHAGRILGKRIRIPRGYEKRTGAEFEQERQSFAYQFRENIWPILRLALVFVAVAALLGLAGYNYIYRPLYARSLYVQGLELIEADQYSLGNQTFDRAWEVWPNSDWYYEYADAFEAERQYTLAQEKYEELLFGRDPAIRELANEALREGGYAAVHGNHTIPKRGALEYAELESEVLGNYEHAEHLINLILFRATNDYEARLALGDNFMRWAEEDPARFEDARLSYARLIEQYGQTDELLFRMMRYFIATDNLEEVLRLKEAFQADPRAVINPEIYAELAGYLIDNDLLADVEDVVFRAMEVDRTIPELHYHLARYYREISAFGEEDLALDAARRLLTGARPLSASRRAMLIDTHTRIGENHYDAGEYLDAQESFTRAIEIYEESRDRRLLGADAMLARAYARLGDVFYYVGREYELALAQFDQAETNGYESSDLDYKQGFVHYRGGRLERALTEFREASDDPSASTNALLWSTANTHFRRGNLFASEAYYRELLDRVERERDSIRTLLVDEDERHQSVIEYLYRGYNNLGVALHELSQETGEPEKYSQSLVYFTRSTELAENYQRDPRTLSRSDAVDLAYLNQREALYPRPRYEMQIYNDIPQDLDDLTF